MVVAEEDQVRLHLPNWYQEIMFVAEDGMTVGANTLYRIQALSFIFIGRFSFDLFYVYITCNNHVELAPLLRFAQDKFVAGV